jgi:photosystem II stability/assembly factor-like uncharacterized protein
MIEETRGGGAMRSDRHIVRFAAVLATIGLAGILGPSPAGAWAAGSGAPQAAPALGPWSTHGPVGGEVDAVAVAPSNPQVAYALSGVGLFKTLDGGVSWTLVSRQGVSGPPVYLVVDPTDPDTLYGGDYSGVFKSADGGLTWSRASKGLPPTNSFTPGRVVSALAIDPTDPQTLYVGVLFESPDGCDDGEGIYKTTDGGSTWSHSSVGIKGPFIEAVAVDPSDPNTVYAASSGSSDCFGGGQGVYRSSDGGGTWKLVEPKQYIYGLAIDPSDPATVYAVTGSGMIKTADGGSSWRQLQIPFAHASVTALVVEPGAVRTVFAAACCYKGRGIYRSDDLGAHWSPADSGLTDKDVYAMALASSGPQILYAGTDTGLFRSQDGGASWDFTVSLIATCITGLAESTTGTLYAGSYGQVFRSGDGGATWSKLPLPGSDSLAASPAIDSVAFEVAGRDMYRTLDGGATWSLVGKVPSFYVPVLVPDPQHVRILYAVGDAERAVFKTTDWGKDWTKVNTGLPRVFVDAMAVDPSDPRTVYAGAQGYRHGGPSLFATTNGGRTWRSSGLAGHTVTALAVSPSGLGTVYAGTTKHGVLRSSDGGRTWLPATSGLPPARVTSIVVDAIRPGVVYAGTWAGVYVSSDGGSSWSAVNEGLTDPDVTSLAIDPTGAVLHAGTCGGGVFDIRVG